MTIDRLVDIIKTELGKQTKSNLECVWWLDNDCAKAEGAIDIRAIATAIHKKLPKPRKEK